MLIACKFFFILFYLYGGLYGLVNNKISRAFLRILGPWHTC